jgi:hypothetical protein
LARLRLLNVRNCTPRRLNPHRLDFILDLKSEKQGQPDNVKGPPNVFGGPHFVINFPFSRVVPVMYDSRKFAA